VLPLGRFSVLRSGTCEDAYASIRTRHPGVHGFETKGPEAKWRINVNVLNLGRANVIASQTSAFSIGNMDDGIVRIYLPLSQCAEIRTRGRRHPLTPGSVTFAPVGNYGCDFADGFRGLITTFPRSLVEETMRSLGVETNLSSQLDAVFSHGAWLAPVKRQILSLVRAVDLTPHEIIHEQRFRQAHQELLLLHLAQALVSSGKAGEAQKISSLYLARATEYIRANLSDEIGPIAIAEAAGCSLRNLQLLFRREYGQTITETVRDMRLRAARDRIVRSKGRDSVTVVALESGFSHLSDFARHYRDTFGERPSDTIASARSRNLI
jgi:AraC-like DNA-binding protein